MLKKFRSMKQTKQWMVSLTLNFTAFFLCLNLMDLHTYYGLFWVYLTVATTVYSANKLETLEETHSLKILEIN